MPHVTELRLTRLRAAFDRVLTPSPASVAIAAAVFFAADWGNRLASGSAVSGGPLDETAHLLSALLVLWAVGQRAQRFLAPALIASVVIDVDHLPGLLGSDWLTAGTPRPYTHSLLTIAIVLLGGALWRRRRYALLGFAIGLAIHFWRDLADFGTGVSILWPLSLRPFAVSHASYLGVMAVVIAVAAYRSRPQPVAAHGPPVPQE